MIGGSSANGMKKILVMSLFMDGARVGCALYKQEKCLVECFEVDVGTHGMLECEVFVGRSERDAIPGMAQQFPPSMRWLLFFFHSFDVSVLLPDAGADVLEGVVNAYCRGKVIKLASKSAFSCEGIMERLTRMYPGSTDEVWQMRLNAKHKIMLRSLSALLHFTSNVRSDVFNVVETRGPRVLFVEDHTAVALQLSRKESHPCDYQGVGKAKEGLSLFTVLNKNQSVLGETKLRQWFAFPSRNAVEIEERQDVVSFFLEANQQRVLGELRSALHHVHPTETIFNLLRSGKARVFHYRRLVDTIEHFLIIYDLLLPYAEKVSFIMKLIGSINPSPLKEMVNMIRHTFVGMKGSFHSGVSTMPFSDHTGYFETRSRNSRGSKEDAGWREVKNAVSPVISRELINTSIPQIQPEEDPSGLLKELRVRLSELHLSLEQKGREIRERLQYPYNSLFPVECVHLPSPQGYLVCVEKSSVLRLQTDYVPLNSYSNCEKTPKNGDSNVPTSLLERLEKQCNFFFHHEELVSVQSRVFGERYCFSKITEKGLGERMLFFKSPEMLELDEYVGDLQERIKLREAEIRWEIDRLLVLHSLYLIPPSDYIAELDCLLSFAYTSHLHSWSRPRILKTRGQVFIRNGWHPILGSAIGRGGVIPFSFDIQKPEDRICLILGVNGSGKSVIMSAVALIAFMTQLGCFVPAEHAEMSIMSSILAASPVPMEDGTQSSFFAECSSLGRTLAFCEADRRAFAQPCECETSDTPAVDSSLILIDELGKGTAPEDGRALLGSVLRYFTGLSDFVPGQGDHRGSMASCLESDPSYPSTGHTNRIADSWRPIVLCATHLVEMLDYTRDLNLHQHAPTAVFPFGLVQIYDMQSAIILRRRSAIQRSFNTSCLQVEDEEPSTNNNGGGIATAKKHRSSRPNRKYSIPVDIIPTYIPHCITKQTNKSHEENYFSYLNDFDRCSRGGLSLGRHCGLVPWLQRCWEETFWTLKGRTNAETF